MKTTISALLDPSSLRIEDSPYDDPQQDVDLSDIKIIPQRDYDSGTNVSAYMSRYATLVIGELRTSDCLEYRAIEIDIQSRRHYLKCLENNMPKSIDEALDRKYTASKIQTKINESDMFMENTPYSQSSISSRFVNIQKGMMETSGILRLNRRYRRKMKSLGELLMLNSQEKQRRYGLVSEVLLFMIALIHLFYISSNIFRGNIPSEVIVNSTILVAVVGLIGISVILGQYMRR